MTNIKEIKKDFYYFMDEKCEEAVGDLVSDELYDQVKDDLIVRLVKSVMKDYPDTFNGEKPKSTKKLVKTKMKPSKRKSSLNERVTQQLSNSNCGSSTVARCGFSTMRCGG